ncbi:MAG TPA: response regulator transcription factor [Candidatus Corynebacterium gallistercoris]|uniref:Response regulator transcription factor n=1 Tax=Candidatus Corynebacterium gallistercoris TaxID=2838530 RepID=A0A9D1RZN5_9CORY|nr:response regulator transcription factor [Candidatus Corynebacterium gallistercoris]
MISVIIADDHPVVRAGLKALLEAAEDIRVVGDVGQPDEAVGYVQDHPGEVDVVLMDLRFGEKVGSGPAGGVDATGRIRALPAAPQVLVVTNYSTDGDVVGAVSAGAVGYLLKDCGPDELIAGVRRAAAGENVMSTAVMGKLLGRINQPFQKLTPRELEVLQLIAQGKSNRLIAQELILTEATVKSHVGNMFGKLGVQNRTSAVSVARERGIL